MHIRLRLFTRLLALWLLWVPALCLDIAAQDQTNDTAVRETWQKTYQSIAESITMRHGEERLRMLDKPLLFYTNPVRTNDQHGAIFLWTESERPAVIASIWSSMNQQNRDSRFVTHEWHSLVTDENVSASRDGKRLWTPGESGITWEPLAEAPTPADQRPARLLQMRSLARRFSVAIQVEGESDLRLMAQPLYRYPENVAGAVDGAIFSFAMTTDPELLVLLEDRENAGHSTWQVAFARFGNKAMTVKDGDKNVWSCQAGKPGVSNGRYYLKWRAEEMPAKPQVPTTGP